MWYRLICDQNSPQCQVMTQAPVPKLQVCSDSDSITTIGTRNRASSHSPAGRLSRYGASAFPGRARRRRVTPAAGRNALRLGHEPWVIGRNRLFHAVSSSWDLYW